MAKIPFTNGAASKKRPVLILWIDGNDAIVAAVTSAKPRTQTDVILFDWSARRLRVASTVRLSRLDCLENSLLLAKSDIFTTKTLKISKQFGNTVSNRSFNNLVH